jgi:acid phosphatase family membrane protein YuiD
VSIYNPYIVIPFITWVIAQLVKFFLAALRHDNKFDLRYLYASGGMPSAHSAVVCSLAITALLHSGVTSPAFGIAAVFAAIVMYDSFGVRRAAGEQAAAINAILDSMSKQRLGFTHPQQRLREILGHKPLEVTVGALAGVALGLVFNAQYLSRQISWLTSFQGQSEAIIYAAASSLVIIVGLVGALWLKQRYGRSAVIKRLRKQILIMTVSVGLTGLVLSFAAYQKALYLGWRLWLYLLAAVAMVWVLGIINSFSKTLPQALAQEAHHQRIRSWLPTKRRRKRKG